MGFCLGRGGDRETGEREGKRKWGGTDLPPCTHAHKHTQNVLVQTHMRAHINAHSYSKPSGFHRHPITIRDDIWGAAQINQVKGKTRFRHLRETPDNERESTPLIEIGERERQRKEGGGQRRGSHTQEERREATHCCGVQNSERQGQRRDRQPSSLTRGATREGRKTRAPGLSYRSSNFKPAPKGNKERRKEKSGFCVLYGFLWTFSTKLH